MIHKFFRDLYLNMLTTILLRQLKLSVWVLTARSPRHTLRVALLMPLSVPLVMRYHVSYPQAVVLQLQLWRLRGLVSRSPWAPKTLHFLSHWEAHV
jgi:hypothetical protein